MYTYSAASIIKTVELKTGVKKPFKYPSSASYQSTLFRRVQAVRPKDEELLSRLPPCKPQRASAKVSLKPDILPIRDQPVSRS